jgi:hypothetical protein
MVSVPPKLSTRNLLGMGMAICLPAGGSLTGAPCGWAGAVSGDEKLSDVMAKIAPQAVQRAMALSMFTSLP